MEGDKVIRLTVSPGVAEFEPAPKDAEGFTGRADLYASKQEVRNKVRRYEGP